MFDGAAFAPRRQGAREARASRIKIAQPLQPQPRRLRISAQRARVGELGEFLVQPLQTPETGEILLQALGEGQQVMDVIERVGELLGRERAA